ncbi:hypothetical protein [Microcoleus sp. CAWBG58]|nr:hypothetical protein [Microcoleus sp. CAWBG58]
MNSLILISPSKAGGFQPILSGKLTARTAATPIAAEASTMAVCWKKK